MCTEPIYYYLHILLPGRIKKKKTNHLIKMRSGTIMMANFWERMKIHGWNQTVTDLKDYSRHIWQLINGVFHLNIKLLNFIFKND